MSWKTSPATVALAAMIVFGPATGHAQQPRPQSPEMTFFVTSAGFG